MPARPFDLNLARELLIDAFVRAEESFRMGNDIVVDPELSSASNVLFASGTQSYREALIGCALARIVDPGCDIRLPYVNHGPRAFNGRTLDERVVNPFLQDRRIPCSKGPYLASIRRSVRFVPETAVGLRDKGMYAAFLTLVGALETADEAGAVRILEHVLHRFVALREASDVPVSRVLRLSARQTARLLAEFGRVPSGGLIPVLIAVATLETVVAVNGLGWTLERQGINVADKATGAGGDITLRSGDRVAMAIEVTEREIDEARVVSTFQTKIVPHGLENYLFLHADTPPTEAALAAAERYFALGHDIGFARVDHWATMWTTTLGQGARLDLIRRLTDLLAERDVPAGVKVAWNDIAARVIG